MNVKETGDFVVDEEKHMKYCGQILIIKNASRCEKYIMEQSMLL